MSNQKAIQFVEQIRGAMREKNLTYYRLHKMTGLSQSTIRDLFTRQSHKTMENICTIAEALNAEVLFVKKKEEASEPEVSKPTPSFRDANKEVCPKCNGEGEFEPTSCCGDPVDRDYQVCRTCKEHCVYEYETCDRCNGEGYITIM